MKNVLAALVLVLVGQGAFANHQEDIRLMYQVRPSGMLAGGKTSQIVVLKDGTVEARTRQAIRNGLKKREIARLSSEEMDTINRLVDEATEAETIFIKNQIFCIVAPTTHEDYVAENGKVTLKSGHKCSGWTVNESRAAFHLIRRLDILRKLALTGTSEAVEMPEAFEFTN